MCIAFFAFVQFIVCFAAPVYLTVPNEYSCREIETVHVVNPRATYTGRCDQYYEFYDAPRPDTIRELLESQRAAIEYCIRGSVTRGAPYEMTIVVQVGERGRWRRDVNVSMPSASFPLTSSAFYNYGRACVPETLESLRWPGDVRNGLSDRRGYTVTWNYIHPKPVPEPMVPWVPQPTDRVNTGQPQFEDE